MAISPRSLPVRLTALALVASSLAAQTVSPADRTAVEGSGSTFYPLGRHNARVQQLHGDIPASLTTIHGHAYRRDAINLRGQVPAFGTELQVQLSPSPRAAGSPSRTFADNAAPVPTIVLPRATVSFPATGRPGADPAPSFDLAIPYAIPFAVPQGSVLCLDVQVFGNQTVNGNNLNFQPEIDAHDTSTSRVTQPGYRHGQGCPAPGATSPHTGRLTFRRDRNGLALAIASRDGVPSDATATAVTVLALGASSEPQALPWLPGCTLYPRLDMTVELPGATDADGDWDGELAGLPAIPVGLRIETQLVSGSLQSGALSLSDASWLTVPALRPAAVVASRIANSTDGTSATGSTSTVVPVTSFF